MYHSLRAGCIILLALVTIICANTVISNSHDTRAHADHKLHAGKIALKAGVMKTIELPTVEQHVTSLYRKRGLSMSEGASAVHGLRNQFLVQVQNSYPLGDARAAINSLLSLHDEAPGKLIYIPHQTFGVLTTYQTAMKISQLKEIAWVGVFKEEWKLSQPLADLVAGNPGEDLLKNSSFVLHVTLASDSGDLLSQSWLPTLSTIAHSLLANTIVTVEATSTKIGVVINFKDTSYTTTDYATEEEARAAVVSAVVEFISQQPETHWVESFHGLEFANKFARPIVTSPSSAKPASGLQGLNQIIGVADSGLDMNHCFFSDENYPTFEYNKLNPAHRKVVLYQAYADEIDVEWGHGTHVCGSVAGNAATDTNGINEFRGLASDAKLAFVDISLDLYVPLNLNTGLYPYTYGAGARIHSDSWGSSSLFGLEGSYASRAQEIDQFMYEHMDFLIFRAAGNNGANGFGTVFTEAACKNCITVGATLNSYESYMALQQHINGIATAWEILEANCPTYPPFCNITPANCCEYVANGTDVSTYSLCCNDTLVQTFAPEVYSAYKELYTQDNIAYFSSKGPTQDGRIKPDICAPGSYIVSAAAGSTTCDGAGVASLMGIQGTSMSTPITAGTAAILRQYFTDGYFPSGVAGSNPINPSAALLKSVLVSSSDFVNGVVSLSGAYFPANITNYFTGASYSQGFGALHVGNMLTSTTDTVWLGALQPNKSDALMYEFGTAGYCVFARDVQPDAFIKGTLTWTDPPASPSSLISLVNNLDLQLIVDDIAYFGNALYGSSGYQQADFVNTVEQVDTKMFRIPVVEGKLYHFKVLGSNIPVSPQPYSMVVRGSGVKLQQTRCPDCVRAGDSQVCPITNGVGMQICGSDLFYSRCDVLTCNTDYTYNSGTNECVYMLSVNYVFAIVSGTCVIMVLICGLYVYIAIPFHRPTTYIEADEPEREFVYVRLYRELFHIARPIVWWIVIGTMCGLVSATASLFEPFYLTQLLNSLPTATDISQVSVTFIALAGLMMVEQIMNVLRGMIFSHCTEWVCLHIRERLFFSITKQDGFFFDKHNGNEITSWLAFDSTMFKDMVVSNPALLFAAITKLVGSIAFLFIISWKLSLVFFCGSPVLVLIVSIYGEYAKVWTQTYLVNCGILMREGGESVNAMKMIYITASQDAAVVRFNKAVRGLFTIGRRIGILGTIYGSARSLLYESLAIVIFVYASLLIIGHSFTVPLMIAYFIYVGYIVDSSGSFAGIFANHKNGVGASAKIMPIMAKPYRRVSGDLKDPIKGDIVFRKISWIYPSKPDKVVLKKLSMKFDAGKVYAIVGSSGSGKSTIFQMLMRLYDFTPYEGQIALDGTDLRDWDRPYLATQMCLVDQDPFLFDATIEENIVYGYESKYTQEQIEHACKMVNAHNFIMDFSLGYKSRTGERGRLLSGGQRKRVALARAFLGEHKVLLLDEPTGDLDAETESIVNNSIFNLPGKTVIMTAHKLNTIGNCACIMVLKEGKLVEQGTFEELVARGGHFLTMLESYYSSSQQNAEWDDQDIIFTEEPAPAPAAGSEGASGSGATPQTVAKDISTRKIARQSFMQRNGRSQMNLARGPSQLGTSPTHQQTTPTTTPTKDATKEAPSSATTTPTKQPEPTIDTNNNNTPTKSDVDAPAIVVDSPETPSSDSAPEPEVKLHDKSSYEPLLHQEEKDDSNSSSEDSNKI